MTVTKEQKKQILLTFFKNEEWSIDSEGKLLWFSKKTDEPSEEKFKELGEAYEVLSDVLKRAEFDASINPTPTKQSYDSYSASSSRSDYGASASSYNPSGFTFNYSSNYDPYSTFNKVFATDPFCDAECDDNIKSFRQATDLIEFDQNRVSNVLLNAFPENFCIGNK